MATRQEVLSQVREKYPQYKDIEDGKLADALSAKYPEYRESLANDPAKAMAEEEVKAGLLGGTGEPMSREDAVKMSRRRLVERGMMEGDNRLILLNEGLPNERVGVKGQGVVPQAVAATVGGGFTSGPARLIEEGLLKTGLTTPEVVDAIGMRRSAEENPGSVTAGNLVGGLAPAGKVFQGVSATGKLTKAALLGAGYGASESIAEGGSEKIVNRPGEILKDATVSAALSTILPGILEAPVAGKILLQRIAVGKVKPETQAILAAAKELEIPITPAQATGSTTLGGVEKGLESLPTSSGVMQGKRDAIQAGLTDRATKLLDENGQRTGVQSFGEELQGRLSAREGKFKTTASKLYDKFEKAIPEGVQVPLGRARGLAEDFIEREGKKEGFASSKLMAQLKTFIGEEIPEQNIPAKVLSEGKTIAPDFINEFGVNAETKIPSKVIPGKTIPKQIIPAQMNARTFLDVRAAVNDEINSAIKNERGDVARKLGMIKSEMDKSLGDFAKLQGGDIEKSFQLANGYYAAGAKIFNDRRIQRMIEKDPGQLYDMIAQPGTVKEINTLKAALGVNRFEPVKRALMEKILATDGADVFSPAKFGTSLSKFEPETLQAAFGKQKVEEISKFWKVAEAVVKNEKRVGNPSGTAKNLIAPSFYGGVGYVMFTNPATGVAALLTPNALAKLYNSETGMKLLTEAAQTSSKSARATEIFNRLAVISGSDPIKEKPDPSDDSLKKKILMEREIKRKQSLIP